MRLPGALPPDASGSTRATGGAITAQDFEDALRAAAVVGEPISHSDASRDADELPPDAAS